MESLYLDISDYLPDEEAEAVERAIEDVNRFKKNSAFA